MAKSNRRVILAPLEQLVRAHLIKRAAGHALNIAPVQRLYGQSVNRKKTSCRVTGPDSGGPVLWGGDAVEVEAEEGVGIGIEADLGVGRIGRVGRAGIGASKTLFVDEDVDGVDRAEAGIREEGDGHGVEGGGGCVA